MKKFYYYSLLTAIIGIDIAIFVSWAVWLLLSIETKGEKFLSILFYILGCIIILILTSDIVRWIEKQLHN